MVCLIIGISFLRKKKGMAKLIKEKLLSDL